MDFKREEIREYINNILNNYDDDDEVYNMDENGEMDWSELHNDIFNTCYFITDENEGYEWFESVENYVKIQQFVNYYQMNNYGETTFDITDHLKVINMYCYIIGEVELPIMLEERYKEEMSEILNQELENNEPKLIDKIWSFFAWFYYIDDVEDPEKPTEFDSDSDSDSD